VAVLSDGGPADVAAALALGDALLGPDAGLAADLAAWAANVADRGGQWSDVAAARERQVRALVAAGRTDEARAVAPVAEASARRVDDDDVRLGALTNLAAAMREVGLADRAIVVMGEVLAQRRARLAIGDPQPTSGRQAVETLAAGLVNLATILIDQGQAAEGLELLTEAADHARTLSDPIRLGTIHVNQAIACSSVGELRLARAAYREAADRYRDGGAAPADLGFAVRGEAATLARSGRYAEARALYEEAHRLFEAAGSVIDVARTAVGLLMSRVSLGERIDPTEVDAMEERLAGLPPNEKGQLARNLGNIVLRAGDPARAESLYVLARDQFVLLDRPADIASIDSNRAVLARRQGDFGRARQLLLAARQMVEPLQRWQQVGQLDHNLALILTELAERGGDDVAGLRAEASARATDAVSALDRFRHDLPTARDRLALEQSVYPGLFPVAIETALAVDRVTTVAGLVERARVQPVLLALRGELAFLEPRPIAARPGDPPVGGSGPPVHLAEEAERLAGPGACWIGWWADDTDLVQVVSGHSDVRVGIRALGDTLTRLAEALPIPTDAERERCRNDALADHLALWRAARGPLVADPQLAGQVAVVIPPTLRESIVEDTDDARLLWPLSRLLLGDVLLNDMTAAGPRRRLVLAPPPLLGRIPWAALPITDPDQGPPLRLVEVADLVVALPASLSAALTGDGRDTGEVLLVADSRGDLRHARRLQVADVERLGEGHAPASREAFIDAAGRCRMLVLAGHVRPGEPADPAASAILLRPEPNEDLATAMITVADLAALAVPPVCVLLGCDGAGAATGTEWTGIATGLAWAGARTVVTTTWPVIDDRITTRADEDLIGLIRRHGPHEGLWRWQRSHAAALRGDQRSPANSVYRWAGTVVLGSPPRSVDIG
jgi:tetratricopeptide (TPR) repeat protein